MEENFTQPEITALTTSEVATPNNITLPKLEEEIKSYFKQIKQHYIDIGNNTIEIGKRLVIAKSLLKHGEWINWLQDNFHLSYRSAKNFMDCAERFPNVKSIADLNSTQMIQLLSLPDAKETEKFIEQKESEGTPISDMSVKTLRQEIKKWKAEKEKITPNSSIEDDESVTIDISTDSLPQNQNYSVHSVSNENDTILLDNIESNIQSQEHSLINSQSPSQENQSSFNETPKSNDDEEPSTTKTNSEIQESHLIEEISNMCASLIQLENRNTILQRFAENNPNQLAEIMQNLNAIVSELQAILNKD